MVFTPFDILSLGIAFIGIGFFGVVTSDNSNRVSFLIGAVIMAIGFACLVAGIIRTIG